MRPRASNTIPSSAPTGAEDSSRGRKPPVAVLHRVEHQRGGGLLCLASVAPSGLNEFVCFRFRGLTPPAIFRRPYRGYRAGSSIILGLRGLTPPAAIDRPYGGYGADSSVILLRVLALLAFALALLASAGCSARERGPVLTLGICDPLARETASDCVKGAAVREFDGLVRRLRDRDGLDVRVIYFPYDALLVDEMRAGHIDAVLAKTWTVHRAGEGWDRLADLLTVHGSEDLSGVFIARADSRLKSVADLKGKKLLLGPDGAYEKSLAARRALHDADVLPECINIIDGCVPLAAEIIEKRADAGVVSSYVADFGGLALLGETTQFKELGRTKPMPFMTFAVSMKLRGTLRIRLREALLEMTGQNVPDGLYTTGFTAPAPWNPEEPTP